MPKNKEDIYCPDCGEKKLRHVEDTTPDFTGEYKEVRICDNDDCVNIVYIVRSTEMVPCLSYDECE